MPMTLGDLRSLSNSGFFQLEFFYICALMDKFSTVRIAMREHTSGRLGDIGQPYKVYRIRKKMPMQKYISQIAFSQTFSW